VKQHTVIIVGAGLTGLSAALHLSRAGVHVTVIERSSSVGGRVKSTRRGGFILDEGFQVVLSAYPELKALCNPVSDLGGKAFCSGARLQRQHSYSLLLNPLRHPNSALRSALSPLGSLKDKVLLAALGLSCRKSSPTPRTQSTLQYLEGFGFSQAIISSFFLPFFGGVFLDQSLSADAGLFRFLLHMFGAGDALLLQDGASTLPRFLAAQLPENCIYFNKEVVSATESEVVLSDGSHILGAQVIVAVDLPHCAALGLREVKPHRKALTLYMSAQTAPYPEPLLTLNCDPTGVINQLAILTNVQPSYSESSDALLSISLRSNADLSAKEIVRRAIDELRVWFGDSVNQWEQLELMVTKDALPTTPSFGPGWESQNGVFLAGDYLSYGSQNGALAAGRGVAEGVLASLQGK
jgi:protoporphyrinogen oxidase